MQVKLNILNESADEFGRLRVRLEENADELHRIISKYRDITCVKGALDQIYMTKNSILEEGEYCGQFKTALEAIRTIYERYEAGIVDRCEEVHARPLEAKVIQQNLSGVSAEVTELLGGGEGAREPEWNLYSKEALDMLKDMKSQLGTVEDISEIYSMFGGESAFMKILGEYAEEVGDLNILKTAGYLGDCSNLLEALEGGDADKIEDLMVKYGKKGMGKLLDSATGVGGITGATYVSIGVSAGENFVEEIKEFNAEPSLGSLAGIVWGATGGAMWDAGAELAKDGLDLVYTILGKDFDEADFDMAMDFVSNAMETLVEDVANGIGNIGTAAVDAASGIAEAVWDGACNIGKTVASWFDWF